MIKLPDNTKIRTFDYLYAFVMVIYMAMGTRETSRMVSTLSGNPIPFLIPIILTIIVLNNKSIGLGSKSLVGLLTTFALWQVLLFAIKVPFNGANLSYCFFFFYGLIMAFIHVRLYGLRLLPIYESIMVKLSIISLFFYIIAIVLPFTAGLFKLFEPTEQGNMVLYLYNWVDPANWPNHPIAKFRNTGCSWEAGRFAIMIVLAIYCNLCRNGLKFKRNKNLIVLVLTLATTMSTTGYVTTLILFLIFYIRRWSMNYILAVLLIGTPVIIGIAQLDFMYGKIMKQLEVKDSIANHELSYAYIDSGEAGVEKDEYRGSLDRFESAYYEFTENVPYDPILGYGLNNRNSHFYKTVTSNFVLTGGVAKIFSMFGIPLAILIYILLWKSSCYIADNSSEKRRSALMVIFLACSISYPVFMVPIFTAFWLMGLFHKQGYSIAK